MNLTQFSGKVVFAALVFSLGIIAFLSPGCKHKPTKPAPSGFSDDAFIEKLQTLLKPVDTTNKKKWRSLSEDVRYAYQSDEYQPIWVKENYRPTPNASMLIAELEDLEWDGADTTRLKLTALRRLKVKLDTTKNNSIGDAINFDTSLTYAYLSAAKFLLMGDVLPKKVDSLWFHVNDSVWNAPEFLVNSKGTYPPLSEFRSKVPTYQLLRDEFKHYYTLAADSNFLDQQQQLSYQKNPDSGLHEAIFSVLHTKIPWFQTTENDTMNEETQLITAYQDYAGLKRSGKLDSATINDLKISPDTYLLKLRANMERVRWMQKEFGNLYIVVDVPLMELFFRKDGVNQMHMNVVVGKQIRQTPSLFATMANIVINPPWGVPPTILKNDVLPGFEKSGKKYLAKKGLKAYDRKGKQVSSSSITMRNIKKFTYKQDPGDDNSLGYVKFNLPNPWDIYLHDTPHRGDFNKRDRALSSGCIRLQQPQEMALYILAQLENKKYDSTRLSDVIETHKTRWEILKNKIPVHITYLTAFEDTAGKHLRFTRDIYGRDEKLISMLK